MSGAKVGLSGGNKVLLAFVVIFFAWLIKCNFFTVSRPLSYSQEYLTAHGVKEGQPVDLILNGIRLRVPVRYKVDPYTDGDKKIVEGEADSAEIYINVVGSEFSPPPNYSMGEVRIRIADKGTENEINKEEDLKWRTRGRGSELPSLGLKSYDTDAKGGWGNLIFEPLDGTRTPKGGRVIFKCDGATVESAGQCRTFYQHSTGLLIEYFFYGSSLSNWKAISSQVVKFVDSIVVPGRE